MCLLICLISFLLIHEICLLYFISFFRRLEEVVHLDQGRRRAHAELLRDENCLMYGFYYHYHDLCFNNSKQLDIRCLKHVVICLFQVKL